MGCLQCTPTSLQANLYLCASFLRDLSQQAPVPHHLLAPHFDFLSAVITVLSTTLQIVCLGNFLAGLFTDTSIGCNRSVVFAGNRQT